MIKCIDCKHFNEKDAKITADYKCTAKEKIVRADISRQDAQQCGIKAQYFIAKV